MCWTINFNDQVVFQRNKICNIWPYRMLSPEFSFNFSIPYFLPQGIFSFRLWLPVFSGKCFEILIDGFISSLPTRPSFRTVSLVLLGSIGEESRTLTFLLWRSIGEEIRTLPFLLWGSI